VRTILIQLFEKQTESQHIEPKKYSPNQKVFAKNYARGEKWIKAVFFFEHPKALLSAT